MLSRRTRRTIAGLGILVLVVVAGWRWARTPTKKLISQARTALANGRPADAERLALRVADRDGNISVAWILAAKGAQQQGHLTQAVDFLRKIRTVDAEGGRARALEAEILIRMGKLMEASHAIEAAASAAPREVEIRKQAVHLLVVTGRRRAATLHLLEIVRLGQFSDGDLRLLGDNSRVVEDPAFLKKARDEAPNDPGVLLGLAEMARNAQEWDQARTLYELALQAAPELDEAWAGLGMLALKSNDFESWEQSLPSSHMENPDIWYLRGRAAYERGDFKGAARCAWESARRDPGHQSAHYLAGQVLIALDEKSRALPFVKHAESLQELTLALDSVFQNPGNPRPMREAARLTESLQRPWEAFGWASLVLTLRPRDEFARGLRDRIRHQLNADTPQTTAGTSPAEQVDLSGFPLPTSTGPSKSSRTEIAATSGIRFEDVAAKVGIRFVYDNGRKEDSSTARITETTGGGVAVLDFDRNGRPDLYFTQGGRLPAAPLSGTVADSDRAETSEVDRLFRNDHGERFSDATFPSGLGDRDYSQGATVGDYDNDGFPDLYVANLGPNRLYRNNGDGTFSDVSVAVGITGSLWTTSCLLADLNNDGLPDLYDVNYCDGDLDKLCDDESCSPRAFDAVVDQVWINSGDGKFVNITDSCGVNVPKGYGLGIVAMRLAGESSLGLFIANDEVPNFFFVNSAQSGEYPSYEEQAAVRGLAVDGNGSAQACMGVAAGDADGDSRIDLFVTNFYREPNTLYLQENPGSFVDRSRAAGLYEPSLLMLGFGTQFLDADHDGWLDLVVANGHIDDYRRKGISYQMQPQFFQNTGAGKFRELAATQLGEYFEQKWLGRGLARLDWNGDGLEDFAVSHIGAPAALVTNRTPDAGKSLAVQLAGTESSRDAIGAILQLTAGERSWTAHLCAGDGYHASNERQIVFGLGSAAQIDSLEIRWPSGRVQKFASPPLNHRVLLVEGSPAMHTSRIESGSEPNAPAATPSQTDLK